MHRNYTKYSIKLFLLFLIAWAYNAHSQNSNQFSIQHITTEIIRTHSGISQNSIRCIYEDHKGMLWLGTWDGLNRYDGIDFRIFRANFGSNTSGLTNNTINCINQDNAHNMWIGTDAGINCLNYKNFEPVNFDFKSSKNLIDDTIHAIFIDHNNNVFVGSQNGLFIINSSRDSISKISDMFQSDSELDSIEIRQIHSFKENEIWIGTSNGLFKLNTKFMKIFRYETAKLTHAHISSLLNFKDSLLFIGTENGLNTINLKTNKIKTTILKNSDLDKYGNNVILSMLQFSDSSILIAYGNNGIRVYNFKSEKMTFLNLPTTRNENNANSFNPETEDIMSMYQDNYNNIWLGSAWNGLIRINKHSALFKTFRKTKGSNFGLKDNHIWSFEQDDTSLWIATDKGINIYNFASHRMEYLNTKKGLSSNKIRTIFRDSKNRVWVGTYDKGINIIYPDKSIIQYTANKSNSIIPNNVVWGITEGPNGNIWISTYGGLAKIDIETFETKFFKHSSDNLNSISANAVYNVTIDTKKQIWVSTYRGLNLYKPADDSFIKFLHIQGDSNSLSTNKIFKVYDDNNGNLWIATIGGGLNKMNLETHNIEWFTTHDGLPNNVIYTLIDDGMGYLWLSTNSGICRFNKQTHQSNNYGIDDGLQSNEFNFGAEYIDNDGNVYLGGMRGFNVFNPKTISAKTKESLLQLSRFNTIVSGSDYSLNFGDTIVLNPNNNAFDINFSKLNFDINLRNSFRYKLSSFNNRWIICPKGIQSASYSNLPPGKYRFLLQATDSYGNWSSKTYSISIFVEEYWYKSTMFKAFAITVILVLIWLIIRTRFKRLAQKSVLEKQMFDLERQALRLQMNPHFIFNTLNSIQSYILNNNTKESISYLSKFSKLMRNILNNSGEAIMDLATEVNMLKQYMELEQLRFDNSFDFSIITNKDIDKEYIGIPVMILQPYVENAIIHGLAPLTNRRGFISIKIEINNNELYCTVEDNGVGRNSNKQNKTRLHKPKGMSITKKRLQLQNNNNESPIVITDLFDNKSNPIGTKVELKIRYENLMD